MGNYCLNLMWFISLQMCQAISFRVNSVQKLYEVMMNLLKWLPDQRDGNSEDSSAGSKFFSYQEKARQLCIKIVQMDVVEDMKSSVGADDGEKVKGRYKRLAPFCDDRVIWRIGPRH